MSDIINIKGLGGGTSGFKNISQFVKACDNLSKEEMIIELKRITTPDKTKLETFDNQHPDNLYVDPIECIRFTSLCPKTGQPDGADIYINYIPDIKCVESKSLKLYLFSFRNSGEFMEDITNRIMKNLIELLNPHYIEVYSKFISRGDIFLQPYCNWYRNPKEKNEINNLLDRYYAIRK